MVAMLHIIRTCKYWEKIFIKKKSTGRKLEEQQKCWAKPLCVKKTLSLTINSSWSQKEIQLFYNPNIGRKTKGTH